MHCRNQSAHLSLVSFDNHPTHRSTSLRMHWDYPYKLYVHFQWFENYPNNDIRSFTWHGTAKDISVKHLCQQSPEHRNYAQGVFKEFDINSTGNDWCWAGCEGLPTNAIWHYSTALLVEITNSPEVPEDSIEARSWASKQNHTKPILFVTALHRGSQYLTPRSKGISLAAFAGRLLKLKMEDKRKQVNVLAES